MTEVLRFTARGERDVFVVRQRGREVAEALGFEQPDQVRFATALSEVCRHLLGSARSAVVTFAVHDGRVEAVLQAAGAVPSGPTSGLADGVRAAARLLDTADLTEGVAAVTIRLARRLPFGVDPGPDTVERIRADLARTVPTNVLDELGVQNAQLIAALEEAQRHSDELLRLNAELEETNQGVMALYTQLSDEMEQTNRGVVALYAELDERSAQLREASDAKSRFLRNVSHELRAPVTAILGMTRLVLDPQSEPLTGEQTYQLTLIQTSAGDLLTLVNQLLDLAKAESNRLEPGWAPVDLAAVFGQLRGTLRPLARPSVELTVDDPAGVPPLVTDEGMLVQILRNLLTNGLKFTDRGEVTLTARYDADARRAVLTVTDTGIGIADADQERVFEEFFQVRDAQRAATPGTGLGLPYARRLCGLLGIDLTLDSEPGHGSTFTLRVPRTPSDITGPAAGTGGGRPTTERIPDRADGLARVLVVDDDGAFRHRLRQILEADGLSVDEAADGRAALDAIAAGRPDAIVLDLRMPGMGGLELLGVLAADTAARPIPVLVLTAAELDDVARAATAHAAGVLDKATLDDRQLVDALHAVVRR
ncbi:ATP-binding response regulator [Virgisporangium aurantiacum]|uniref:histidine kinase n=1 Tax=Virgisporangium aurantiacum TaxID=175570 RepID=A0A8J3Z4J8_9ACTN|nr:ATP-binding protein [Virgisporangium aurantiacum]GIJ56672.1 sensor histidine kinase [Virgisporangium aurantiacum]